jgi:hypothetical protein
MDMGMKLEGASPSVKDAKEPRKICADELFIGDQFFNRFGGSVKQGGVGSSLILTDEAAQAFRDSKSEHEMVSWESAFELFVQPLPALVVLTGGAMAISTGAKDPMDFATLFALIQGTLFPVRQAMMASMTSGVPAEMECIPVLGAEGSKDLIDWGHGPGPPLPD